MRRVIGIVASIALVGVGTLLLVGYVSGAEERALAGEELVGVLVVDQAIEVGAAVEDIADAVRFEQVPVKVRVEGAVDGLEDLAGLVTTSGLLPGEQITTSRFADPASLLVHQSVERPPGTVQVTVSLSPERAVGGRLVPGDTVAVIASFDPFDVTFIEPGEVIDGGGAGSEGSPIYVGSTGDDESAGLQTPNSTHLILHGILVTNVQVEQLPPAPAEGRDADAPDLAPTGNLLITMAVTPADAEKIVFTAEHGFLWLAADDEDIDVDDSSIQTRGSIYR